MRIVPVVLIAAVVSPCWAEPAFRPPAPSEPAPLELGALSIAPAVPATPAPVAVSGTETSLRPLHADRSRQPVADRQAAADHRVSDNRVAPVAASEPRARSFDRRLTALDLALATIVSERPGIWRFELLEQEATALLLEAQTEADRQAVRAVALRLDRFGAIADRYRKNRADTVAGWTAPERAPSDRDERIAPPVRRTKARSPAREPGYDAVGVLRPVVSKRPDAPRYAIVGDDGRLLTFVTPSDEVSGRFDDLLGKRIGVDGARGYLTDLRREHVTAQRVTALGSQLR